MPSILSFNGTSTAIPGVYSTIRVLQRPPALGDKNICVVGAFPQLEPFNASEYKYLRGESLNQGGKILNPDLEIQKLHSIWASALDQAELQTLGAGQSTSLTYVNAANSTQAELSLLTDAAYGSINSGSTVGKFKSKIYGTSGNNTRVFLDKTGSINADPLLTTAAIKLTVKAEGLEDGEASVDQRYGNIIELYRADATKTVQIKIENGKLNVGQFTTGGAASTGVGAVVDKALSDFLTINDLYNFLMGTGYFDATQSRINNFNDMAAEKLDELMGSVDINGTNTAFETALGVAGVTETSFISLTTGALVLSAWTEGIDNLINVDAAATLPISWTTTKRLPWTPIDDTQADASDASTVKMASGTNGTMNSDRITTALAACKNQDIQIISLLSDSASDLLLLKDHIIEANQESKFRQAWCGTTNDQTITEAFGNYVVKLAHENIAVVSQSINKRILGRDFKLDPKYTAFLMMCIQGALPPAKALTRVIPNIISIVNDNLSAGQTPNDKDVKENAIRKSLVWLCEHEQGQIRILRSITSYRKDNLPVNCEVSSRESVNLCLTDLQKYLASEIGSKITLSATDKLRSLATSRLIQQRDLGIIKNFQNLNVSIVDDTAYINFDLAVVDPLNFISVTANIL